MNGTQPIREWYRATTRVSRKCVAVSALVVGPAGILLYAGLPQTVHAALQVINGAYTIPAAAAIWIYAFVYLFLVPSRESGFRSVESIERSESLIEKLIDEKLPAYWGKDVKPVLDIWAKLGERLEKRLDAESLERILKGLEGMSEVAGPPHVAVLPDSRRGLGGFNHRNVELRKEETA